MKMDELKEELRRLASERLAGTPGDKSLVVDLVNLDRGGRGGLVYLDGVIVRKGERLLDGAHRLAAVAESGSLIKMTVAQFPEHIAEPIAGAIYVPAGPTPDYVIDRSTRTILIGRSRGKREATRDELRDACRRAINEYFGN